MGDDLGGRVDIIVATLFLLTLAIMHLAILN